MAEQHPSLKWIRSRHTGTAGKFAGFDANGNAAELEGGGGGGGGGSSINWLGAWSSLTAYVEDDAVSYNGSSYICVLDNTNQVPTNALYWDLLASKGDTGSAGAAGATGAAGADGADGTVWRDGSGVPSNGLGVNGDYYLDNDTGDIYEKAAGVYSVVANIEGPAGADGASSTDYFSHTFLLMGG